MVALALYKNGSSFTAVTGNGLDYSFITDSRQPIDFWSGLAQHRQHNIFMFRGVDPAPR
jgi:hypothetical protein